MSSEGVHPLGVQTVRIEWAPGAWFDLTQRYLTATLQGHMDAASAAWLDEQEAEAVIAYVQVPDSEYRDGWRVVFVGASPSDVPRE